MVAPFQGDGAAKEVPFLSCGFTGCLSLLVGSLTGWLSRGLFSRWLDVF